MKVFDVGCGVGHFYPAFEELDQQVVYYGCDISEEYIDVANEIFKEKANVEFLKEDIYDLALPDNSYDIVFSYGTLLHFPDFYRPVSELFRVSKKHLFLRLLLSDHTQIIKRFKPGLTDSNGEPAFVYYNIWSESEFVDYLRYLGCKDIQIYDDEFNIELPKKNNWDTYTFGGLQISGNIILNWKHVYAVK